MSYRYIGNKSRLLDVLVAEVRRITPANGTVADLMCGTASVSEALKCAGFRVIASDIMTYAFCHAWTRLRLEAEPAFAQCPVKSYAGVVRFLNLLPARPGYFAREHAPGGKPQSGVPSRQYLSDSNAARLDAIVQEIRTWRDFGLLTTDELNLLRHDLVLAVNRVANIAGTYGHFRSSWSNGSLRPLRITDSTFMSGFRLDHQVLQGAAEDVAPQVECDLCYLDPPYMKRQYAANYHLIETVARLDEPEAIGLSGLRPWRDQYSDFCSKIKIWEALQRILEGVKSDHFLMSYSEDGLISKEVFVDFFRNFGKVEVKTFANSRFRSNNSALGPEVQEYLFHISRN